MKFPKLFPPLLGAIFFIGSVLTVKTALKENASVPAFRRDNSHYRELHEQLLQRGHAGPIGLLFLGDSLIEGWSHAPEVWQKYYGPLAPANFGIAGDATQHLLWRLAHGELKGLNPRVIILEIGTNNAGFFTPEQIVTAEHKIIDAIRADVPHAKILLLALLPRGPRQGQDGKPDDGQMRMAVIKAVNAQLAKLDDGQTVRFLNLGAKFLDSEGKIPSDLMPDQLHPSAKGYAVWAEAMQPLLNEMLVGP